jgi:hypothetical protein
MEPMGLGEDPHVLTTVAKRTFSPICRHVWIDRKTAKSEFSIYLFPTDMCTSNRLGCTRSSNFASAGIPPFFGFLLCLGAHDIQKCILDGIGRCGGRIR